MAVHNDVQRLNGDTGLYEPIPGMEFPSPHGAINSAKSYQEKTGIVTRVMCGDTLVWPKPQ